jgi:anti-sigma regulatory factor (Ser/Thr protein kinase)
MRGHPSGGSDQGSDELSPGDLAQKSWYRRTDSGVNASQVRLRLPHGPHAVAAARRGLDSLEPTVDEQTLNDMRLLVSELVTNSVRHADRNGSSVVELEVDVSENRVLVRVTDNGPGFEASPRAPEDDPGSGWGLFLVEQISDRWGVELNGSTQVWFELSR